MTDKERIKFLERERIKELQNKSKLFVRLATFSLISFMIYFPLGFLFSFHLQDHLSNEGIMVLMFIHVASAVWLFNKAHKITAKADKMERRLRHTENNNY